MLGEIIVLMLLLIVIIVVLNQLFSVPIARLCRIMRKRNAKNEILINKILKK